MKLKNDLNQPCNASNVAHAHALTDADLDHINGGNVRPDLALSDVKAEDYSAIVFVGGWGSSMYQYDFPGDY